MGAKSTTVEKDIATEAKDRVAASKRHTQELRDRWEADFALYVLDAYDQPTNKQQRDDNESITSNAPAALGNKYIDYLSDGELQFHAKLSAAPTKKERAQIGMNELFVYAKMDEAERNWQEIPEHTSIQGEFSFFSPIFGWIAVRCLMYRDKKSGRVVTDIAPWIPYNTYWGSGGKGLVWADYERYATVDEVKELYLFDAKADSLGRVRISDYWKAQYEYIIIEGKVIKENPTKRPYPPIYIKPCGSLPLIQGMEKFSDKAIKYLGESIFVNNRHLYAVQSEIATYKLNALQMGVFTPQVLWSLVDITDNPIEKNPYAKNKLIILNKTKFDSIQPFVQPALPENLADFSSEIQGMLNMGGAPLITFGDIAQQQTAQGINILSHNALTGLKPRKKHIEQVYDWLANELISQFVEGKYPEQELETIIKDKVLETRISADKLEPSRKVKTELKLNLPQDEELTTAIVLQQLKAEILSLQTARDKVGVQDPDEEQSIIDREKGRKVLGLELTDMLDSLIKDASEGKTAEERRRARVQAFMVKARLDKMYQQLMGQYLTGQAPGTEQPPGGNGGLVGEMMRNPMGGGVRGMVGNRESMTPGQRLQRMGMVQGR